MKLIKRTLGLGLIALAVVLNGCVIPNVQTDQISAESRQQIHQIGLIKPAGPKYITIVDPDVGKAGRITGEAFFRMGGLATMFVGGVIEAEANAVTAKASRKLSNEFANGTPGMEFDGIQLFAEQMRQRLETSGYSVRMIDKERKNSTRHLSKREFASIGAPVDAYLDLAIDNYDYGYWRMPIQTGSTGSTNEPAESKKFVPRFAPSLTLVSPDGKKVHYEGQFQVQLNQETGPHGEPLSELQFSDVNEMIARRDKVIDGLKLGISTMTEIIGESLTIHPSTVYIYRQGGGLLDGLFLAIDLDGVAIPAQMVPFCFYRTLPAGQHKIRTSYQSRKERFETTLEFNVEEGKSYYVNTDFKITKSGNFWKPTVTVEAKLVPEEDGQAMMKRMHMVKRMHK